MKTRLLAWWAAVWLAACDLQGYGVVNAVRREIGLPRRPRRAKPVEPGLNTEADAEAFVKAMHEPGQLTADEPAPVVVESTPIFDALTAEWSTLLARREQALRAPTVEIRQRFDSLVALLAADWVCSHCLDDDHRSCPGCSCMSCSALAVAA